MKNLFTIAILFIAGSVFSPILGVGQAPIPMYIEEKTFSAGDTFALDIWSDQLDGILAWQFRLNFQDAQILEITEGPPFDNIPHNIFNENKTLNSLWTPADTQPVDVPSNETWFTLTILSEVGGSTFDIFTTENDPWSEIVLENGVDISGVAADFSFQIEERAFLVANEEIESNRPSIQQNPVTNRLVISGLDAKALMSSIRVFSLDGRQRMSERFENVEDPLELDVSSLESGLYILRLGGAASQSIKFIKI